MKKIEKILSNQLAFFAVAGVAFTIAGGMFVDRFYPEYTKIYILLFAVLYLFFIPACAWLLRYVIANKIAIKNIALELSKEALFNPGTDLFELLLDQFLNVTKSEYGFIGRICIDTDNNKYLETYAITDIAWNEETKAIYKSRGMEFHNLETLFGEAIKKSEIVISNNPNKDKRAGGIPNGHPPLNSFLGIPLKISGKMIGLIGLANRPKGYKEKIIEDLVPLLDLTSHKMLSEDVLKKTNLEKIEIIEFFKVLDLNVTYWEFGSKYFSNVSKNLLNLLGYSLNEIRHIPLEKIGTLENNQWEIPLVLPSHQLYKQQIINNHLIKKDGSKLLVRSTFYPVYIDGRLVSIFGLHVDLNEEEKRSTEEIKSRRQFESFIMSSPNPKFMYAFNGIEYIHDFSNTAFRNFLGITAIASILSIDKISNHINENYNKNLLAAIEAVKAGRSENLLIQSLDKRYFRFNLTPHFDQNSKSVIAISGSGIDITETIYERMLAEANEERLDNALQYMSDCFLLTDGHGYILDINLNTSNILGYQPKDLLGESITILMDNENASVHTKRFANIESLNLQVGVVVSAPKVKVKHKNGHFLPMEIKSSKYILHEEIYFAVMLHDQTSYVRLLEELERNQKDAILTANQYKNALDNEVVFIFGINDQGIIGFWNKAAEITTGYERENMVGKSLGSIADKDQQEKFTTSIKLAEKRFHSQYEIIDSKGETISLILSSYPVSFFGEELVMFIGFNNSELLEKERLLQQASKMESLGRFTGGIAHDFNNILAIIYASLEYLSLERGEKSDDYHEAVKDAMSAARQGTELASTLLIYARQNTLKISKFDIINFLKNNKRIFDITLGSNNTCIFDYKIDEAYVELDKNELLNSIINILNNAKDSCGMSYCQVRITIDKVNNEEIKKVFSNTTLDSYIKVKILDNGPGIPHELMDSIFDPFFTTKEIGKGSGLGLSRVNGFCRQSGGVVVAENSKTSGEGAIFTLYFKLAQNQTESPIVSTIFDSNKNLELSDNHDIGKGTWYNAKGEIIAASEADLPGEAAGLTSDTALDQGININKDFDSVPQENLHVPRDIVIEGASDIRVLVVEDDALVMKSTVRYLQMMGFDVVSAINAEQALDLLDKDADISVVFTDIMMPGELSGRDLADILSLHYPEKIVKLTSGYENLKDFKISRNVSVLKKPYHLNELYKVFCEIVKKVKEIN